MKATFRVTRGSVIVSLPLIVDLVTLTALLKMSRRLC